MPPAFGDPISAGTLHAFHISANQIVVLRIGAATLNAPLPGKPARNRI
jgi:hypothetical protein